MRLVTVKSPEEVVPALRAVLDHTGITQRQLAAHMGYGTKHLNQLLMGKAGISLPQLFLMLEYLDTALVISPEPDLIRRTLDNLE